MGRYFHSHGHERETMKCMYGVENCRICFGKISFGGYKDQGYAQKVYSDSSPRSVGQYASPVTERTSYGVQAVYGSQSRADYTGASLERQASSGNRTQSYTQVEYGISTQRKKDYQAPRGEEVRGLYGRTSAQENPDTATNVQETSQSWRPIPVSEAPHSKLLPAGKSVC